MWTGKNDAKTLRVDANFFENEGKKLRFQTNTDTCGQGLVFFFVYELLIGPQPTFSECTVISLQSDWSILSKWPRLHYSHGKSSWTKYSVEQ